MKRGRLPSHVNLGLGQRVYVKVVSQAKIRELVGEEADDGTDTYEGFWDCEERTIFIDKSLSTIQKHRVYWHELLHAVHDLSGN